MTPAETIVHAAHAGVTLTARPAGVVTASPARSVMPELADAIREHKPALWHKLMERQTWRRITRPDGGTTWLLAGYEHHTADLDVGPYPFD